MTVSLFSADWADQCLQILDVMKELSKNSSLQFINIPAEDLSDISIQHQVNYYFGEIFEKKLFDSFDC